MRTESEVRTYLKEWQCPEDVLEEVILFLEEYHYLDDVRYAQSYVRQERELHHRSRKDITFRLAAKGVNAELIRQAFEDEEGENAELKQVERLIEKRMRSGGFDPDQTAAYLQRKGFSYSVIRQAMEGLDFSEEE